MLAKETGYIKVTSASKLPVSSYLCCEHADSRDGSTVFPGNAWHCAPPRVGISSPSLNDGSVVRNRRCCSENDP